MLQIITHTPSWVFGLLIALIILGLQQRKNRRVKKPLAFLLPIGMMSLSFAGVLTSFGFNGTGLLMWGLGMCASTLAVRLWFPVRGIQFHSQNNTFFIPGSWVPLFFILAIFMTKYCVGVIQGLNPASLDSPTLKLALSLIYGLLSGYFVGRAACLWAAGKNSAGETITAESTGN